MKFMTSKKWIQKITIILLIIISCNCITPIRSYGATWGDIGGKLLKEVAQLLVAISDVAMGALNNFMLGANGFGSAMLEQVEFEANIESTDSWLHVEESEETDITISGDDMDGDGIIDKFGYPNMLYSPENIFANKIGLLDVNFLKPNQYTSIKTGDVVQYEEGTNLTEQDSQISAASVLSSSIATWYRSFRNISIVGLLSVLVYLGIRILISSTAADKAKYKETLQDWFIALCLVFTIHIIMSVILMLTDQVTKLFEQSSSNIVVEFQRDDNIRFHTNLMGLARFKAQSKQWQDAVAYSLIYLALIIYTCIFTFQYLKRFLYMAFFTMIAPLVALTYPIDRAGDGKSQAFNLWFKEYTMNAIIQPIHLILYTALVATAIELATKNLIYSIVAIGFLVPAEKFIKKMFGINAETTSGMGSFAGGALAMTGLQKLANVGKNVKSLKDSSSSSNGQDSTTNSSKVKFAKQSGVGELSQWSSENNRLGEGNNTQRDEERRQATLDRYNSEGYTQNENGEYRNPYTGEYDSQYSPLDDEMYNGQLDMTQPNQTHSPEPPQQPEQPERIPDRNTGVPVQNNYKRRITGRAARSIGKGVWKATKGTARLAARTAGTAGGAMIGLAAGATTGDFSKAMSYMAGGAAAGNIIAGSATKAAGNIVNNAKAVPGAIRGGIDNMKFAIEEEKYGTQVANQNLANRQNDIATKQFLQDKDEQRKWENVRRDLGYSGSREELMGYVADMKKAGINDDERIKNTLKAEKRYGGIGGQNHQKMVDLAGFMDKNGYDRSYLEDDKKRAKMNAHIEKALPGDEIAQREVKNMTAALVGLDHLREPEPRTRQGSQTESRSQTGSRSQTESRSQTGSDSSSTQRNNSRQRRGNT